MDLRQQRRELGRAVHGPGRHEQQPAFLPSLAVVTVRVDEGTLGTPYTIEAATSLHEPVQWSPLWTTNPPALPFDYVDFDVKTAEKPQKFYRARQP